MEDENSFIMRPVTGHKCVQGRDQVYKSNVFQLVFMCITLLCGPQEIEFDY